MAIYKRSNSATYSYDFQVDGRRYSGSTGTDDLETARRFEAAIRAETKSISPFCRAILRKAQRQIPANPSASKGYVYMLRSGYFIKIRHSFDPAERLKKINTATPDGCELMFCFAGSMKLERELHAEFAACHYKREWFFLCGRLRQFITEFEESSAQDENSHKKSHASSDGAL